MTSEGQRIKEKLSNSTLDEAIEVNMVNEAFYLIEAGIFLAIEFEKMFSKTHCGVRHDIKKRFNEIRTAVKRLEFLCEDLSPFYAETFGEKRIGSAFMEIQKTANWYGRLALLIGDRAFDDEKKEAMIYNYIRKFKTNGMITDEKLESLKLK